jgi:hypothetical protein
MAQRRLTAGSEMTRVDALGVLYSEIDLRLGEAIDAYERADMEEFNRAMSGAASTSMAIGHQLVDVLARPHGSNVYRLHPERVERSAAAERQRRRRARAHHNELVAPVTIGERVIDVLIALRWIDEAAATDRSAIGKGISAMLGEMAQHR